MLPYILIIVSILIVRELFRIYFKRNWVLIHTAFGAEEYFQILSRLKSQGVKFKVETPFRGFDSRINRNLDKMQYDIYVKKEVEHLAANAIHKSI
ncbi:hypothetical protein [Robertmurraya kyonggiensis]|uniref:Uncharacterized protein n=1 Tax=Robertmurraya kyonggiensis TaxID=1037680 RepID=A0A4U1D8G0_9BACI|nr:hypothetical protein [Robertmurraya kyonggiensis]TKC18802.1 hypothetical protein FA727_04390 [Robertmurraya kyonggiensis]